jgi:hypothetical protein
MNIINKIRYFIIESLAGDMPIVMNMNICRPDGFVGNLLYIPDGDKSGIIENIVFNDKGHEHILSPKRDIIISHA